MADENDRKWTHTHTDGLPCDNRAVVVLVAMKDGSFKPDIGRWYVDGWSVQFWGDSPVVAWDNIPDFRDDTEIVEQDESVLVQIRHQRLASTEEIILEYLQAHDEITNSIARSLTGIGSENQVKRVFQRMIRAGELEAIPGRSRPGAAYRLPSQAAD